MKEVGGSSRQARGSRKYEELNDWLGEAVASLHRPERALWKLKGKSQRVTKEVGAKHKELKLGFGF